MVKNFFNHESHIYLDEGIKNKFSNNEAFITLIKDFIDLNKVRKIFYVCH